MAELKTVQFKGIKVFYKDQLHGGGMAFGQDYVAAVAQRFGKVERIYEYCSGPGFIGFSLLAHGLCRSLCLSDINPEAIEFVRRTIRENKLESVVSAYVSDCLAGIPAGEKWDLVVGNPPHFLGGPKQAVDILKYDPDWGVHLKFYKNIRKFLKRGASVFLQENEEGGNPGLFREMIKASGLTYAGHFKPKRLYLNRSTAIKAMKRAWKEFPHPKKMVAAFLSGVNYPYYFIWAKNEPRLAPQSE